MNPFSPCVRPQRNFGDYAKNPEDRPFSLTEKNPVSWSRDGISPFFTVYESIPGSRGSSMRRVWRYYVKNIAEPATARFLSG